MIMQYNPFFVRNPPSHHHAIHSFSFVIWVSKEKNTWRNLYPNSERSPQHEQFFMNCNRKNCYQFLLSFSEEYTPGIQWEGGKVVE